MEIEGRSRGQASRQVSYGHYLPKDAMKKPAPKKPNSSKKSK